MTFVCPSEKVWADLWLLDLSRSDAFTEKETALLNPGEFQRASVFASPEQGREFLASHIGLRQVLSHYGYQDNAPFALGANGKPSLPGAPCFSLSRTPRAALVAVSNAAIGVDLERQRAVNLSEAQILEAGRRLRQKGSFADITTLQVWTAVEAWVKHHGQSMFWFLGNKSALHTMIDDLDSGRTELTFPPLPTPLLGAVCTVGGGVIRRVELEHAPAGHDQATHRPCWG